jgi:hypothetical protein
MVVVAVRFRRGRGHAGTFLSTCSRTYTPSPSPTQIPIVAIQANVSPKDLPQTTALVTFAQLFGAVLGISVCGTVFANELAKGLRESAPEAPFELVRHSVDAIWGLEEGQRAGVIHAYVKVCFCC